MSQRKNPSPLTAPIARLRGLGAKVKYLPQHSPNTAYPYGRIGIAVTLPTSQVVTVACAGHEYRHAVRMLGSIADRIERTNQP